MQMQLSTWQEVEGYLANSTGVIVPIGSTGQHGPTGIIGTDTFCAEGIARRVGEIHCEHKDDRIGIGAETAIYMRGTIAL